MVYKTLNRTWFDAVALSMALVVFGRIFAFFVAGLIGETVTIPVLLFAGKSLKDA